MTDLRVDEIALAEADDTGAVRLRLDAPGRRNALSLATVKHVLQTLTDEPTRTLLLGSSTPGIFSSGADLDVDDATRARLSDLLYACYEQIIARPGITIAVVDGPAVGGGAQLTAACDLRTASARARWRWVGPGHGLAVGAWILPSLLGRARALDLTLTSRWMDAEEAVAAGYVFRVDDDPWQAATEMAAGLAEADPEALTRVKRVAESDQVLRRLRNEREENRASWSGRGPQIGGGRPRPSTAEAARPTEES